MAELKHFATHNAHIDLVVPCLCCPTRSRLWQRQQERDTLEQGVYRALHTYLNRDFWEKHRQDGLDDKDFRKAVVSQMNESYGIAGPGYKSIQATCYNGYPKFWFDSYQAKGKPTLQGTEFLTLARKVLAIPYPTFQLGFELFESQVPTVQLVVGLVFQLAGCTGVL